MAATNDHEDTTAEEPNDIRPRRPRQGESDPGYNPYLAFAGIFKDDPFMDELEIFIEAERQRQRDEAAVEADREDASGMTGEEGYSMTAINNSKDIRAEDVNGSGPGSLDQQEKPVMRNKYMAFAGIFKDDPFIDDIDACIEADRQRERDEATHLADLEDATRVGAEAD